MDQNQEKKNEKKAPFIITAPKQVISSAYLHISDFEEKPRFIVDESGNKVFQKLNPPSEKSNVKAGHTEVLIRKVPYYDDPYERKECLDRFEQLQNKVKIPCPFKCPRNHRIQEKNELKEKTVEYGRKVIKRNISRLLSGTKNKEQTEKLNKLMIKADTLFRSRKIVNNVNQQKNNVYGFDKNLFANVDKWKNVFNTIDKKEQEELQMSKLSFQKQREEQKQQHILESTQKRKEREVKELKQKEIKQQKEQKNKEIQEQMIQKESKYQEMQEQKAQKFRNYDQTQNTSKLSENSKIDLTPKNKTTFQHHQDITKQFKPATPSSFQKQQQNQQDIKNQSFNSISNTQEIKKQPSVDKQQHQIIQKQKSIVQTPKSDTSKLKHIQQPQNEVNSVKSNKQSQKKDSVKKENSIIDQTKQNKSQRSNSQRIKTEEERKSNNQSEQKKIQNQEQKSQYSEERKSDGPKSKTKSKNKEQNQKIIMKPTNFTRASSFRNPNIPKQENIQKITIRASSSGKRIQEEKPLNLNKINLPNHIQDKINLNKEKSQQNKEQKEIIINEVKFDQNQSNLNNFTQQQIINIDDSVVNKNDKLDENIKNNNEDSNINKIDQLNEGSHNNQIKQLNEDLVINNNDKSKVDESIDKDNRLNQVQTTIKDDIQINETPSIDISQVISIHKIDTINDKIKDCVIVPKEVEKTIEFIEQPINEGLLNINDPLRNEKDNEQKMHESGQQMKIMQNNTQHQKGISQIQSTNSLSIKQESNILKESLLSESLVESQFKETKGLDRQLLSSQLNDQESINLSESQATLKSTLQQSQFQQQQ